MTELGADPAWKKKPGVSRSTIFLIFGGVAICATLFLAAAGYLFYRKFASRIMTDPAQVEADAQSLLSFEKPPGFRGRFSMPTVKGRAATLVDVDQHGKVTGSLVLQTANSRADAERILNTQESVERQGFSEIRIHDSRPPETFKVRGEDVTARIRTLREGNNPAKLLRYQFVLKGRSGQTVIVEWSGPEPVMTHGWVQKFLDSVK